MKKIRRKLRAVLRPRRKRAGDAAVAPSESDELGVGAILPPELFPTVLKWVSRNDDRAATFDRLNMEASRSRKKVDRRQFRLEVDKAGPAYTLRSCSLVCLYWANQCRNYVFRDANFPIWSFEKAELFRKYSVDGCRKLVPICTLIKSITVVMACKESRRSFLDLIYLPQTRGKLDTVRIIGPLPGDIPLVKHDTPHWSVTNLGTPPPIATAYETVVIYKINFPSFGHLVRYFKYFNAAETYYLTNLTWDGKTPNHFAQFFKPAIRRRKSITVQVRQCTDDLIICLQVVTMYPDFPLRLIASQDYAWAMYLMNVVGDFYRKLPRAEKEDEALRYSIEGSLSTLESEYHSVLLRISQIPRNHVEISMYFFSQVKSSPTSSIESGRTPPIRTRIIGLEMLVNVKSSANDIDPSQFSILDFGLLMKSIQRHPSTCAIILKFWSYKLLKESTTRFPILLKPMGGKTYILAFFHEEGDQAPGLDGDAGVGKWVEVDRSCKPTGKYLDSQSMLEDALRPSR